MAQKKLLFKLIFFFLPFAYALAEEEIIDGIYQMELTTQEKTFNQILELKGKNHPLSFLAMEKQKISGSLTGPKAITKTFEGELFCNLWSGTCSIDFSIIAHEEGKDFNVNYRGAVFFEKEIAIVGDTRLDGKYPLGTFVASKIK